MSNAPPAETKEEFLQRYNDITTKGYTTLCLTVGQKLKLFNHIHEEPATSEEIAKSAALKERYVREWLNAMVVGNIVEVTNDGNKYWLPKEHQLVLTEADDNSLFFPMFARVFGHIVSCFKLDGPPGMPYSAYTDLHDVNEVNERKRSENFLTTFVPSVPGLKEKLEKGMVCLDVGCGSGVPSFTIAKNFKNCICYGIDFVDSAIEVANARKREYNLENLNYYAYDAAKLPKEWSGKFEYVTAYDTIHDQAYPDKVLLGIYRVLKPGGEFSMMDINVHTNVVLNKNNSFAQFCYAASIFHCMPVSLYFDGGMGLGTCWGREKALEMLTATGFIDVKFQSHEGNFNYHCTAHKPSV